MRHPLPEEFLPRLARLAKEHGVRLRIYRKTKRVQCGRVDGVKKFGPVRATFFLETRRDAPD